MLICTLARAAATVSPALCAVAFSSSSASPMTILRSETSFSRLTSVFSITLSQKFEPSLSSPAMGEAGAALVFENSGENGVATGAQRVRASGAWTFRGLVERRPGESLRWDLTAVTDLDDAGAVWLARALRRAGHIEVASRHQEMLRQASQGLLIPREAKLGRDPLWGVATVGLAGLHLATHLRDALVM